MSKPISTAVPYLIITVIGVLLCVAIQVKYNIDINNLKHEFGKRMERESEVVTDRIEIQFHMLYQGLKTISRMPSIKKLYIDKNSSLTAAKHDTQEIYNLLHTFTQLSEIYVVPKNFDPDRVDPLTGVNYLPSFSLDEYILGKTGNTGINDTPTSSIEEIEIYEYREMKQHLQWLKNHAANESSIQNIAYPALISKELITCDNTFLSNTNMNNNDRKGLIYSVPFYDPNGQLVGSIVGVLLSNNLRKLLPNDSYVIYNASVDYIVSSQTTNDFQASLPWINNDKANPDLIYSNSIRLALPDSVGNWRLWVGSQDTEFWQSAQIVSAKRFSILAQIATLLLTVSLGIIIRMLVRQRRHAEGQNAVLEYKVIQHNQALQKSDAKFRTVLANAAESIIIIDSNGEVEIFNKAAEYTFGYTEKEIIGQPVGILLPTLANKTPDNYIEKYRGLANTKMANKQHELLGVHKDGSTFFAELHLSELLISEANLYTCIVRDISAYKKAEQATRTAKEEAEQSSRTKSEFLANMSHELRTPLNAIIGYCELLIDESERAGNPKHMSDLNNIQSSGYHLLNLINSILDLSKIEAGKMELFLEHFNIRSVIDLAVVNIQPLLAKNKNRVTLDISTELDQMYADTTKVQQIIVNLLGNANKFTNGGEISIYVEQIQQHSVNWIQLYINDTGIGMSRDQLDRLFTEFSQGDSSTTKKYGGTGLGLAISMQFCEMMGGAIKAHSVEGQGSSFVVQLPLAVIEDKVDPRLVRFSDQDKYGASRSKISRVLIIGDNQQSTELISSFLLREGFYTDLAHSVQQAVSIVKGAPPDLVLIDENSVSMNELLDINALKQSSKLGDSPLIMLTKSERQNLASTLSVKDYLPKPIQRNRILDVVFKYVRKQPGIKGTDNYILVVEDDLNNSEVIRRHLESDGHNIRLAANGLEAIAMITEKIPDLIFLDIIMPEMDGFEFVEQLRCNEQWQSIPVIILTAAELTSEQKTRLNNHVETILFKSDIEPSAMLEKLRDIIASNLGIN